MAEPSRRVRWGTFVALVVGVVVLDQLTKAWLLANVSKGEAMDLLGTFIRLIHGENTGGLFGLFQGNAPLFAVVSLAVMAMIVVYESRVGAAIVPTIALGLLLGGAIGNFIDRIRLGYVVDFVDMGIGDLRWYTFNVADAAISASLVLLVLMAVVPGVAELGVQRRPAKPATPAAEPPSPDEARSRDVGAPADAAPAGDAVPPAIEPPAIEPPEAGPRPPAETETPAAESTRARAEGVTSTADGKAHVP
jgi:signal peptidase II